MDSVCVFCGSSKGANGVYAAAAAELGRLLARRGLALVYGGGNVGLMGTLARAALEEGGRVVGVIPEHLMTFEVALPEATEMRVVSSMHERKALMADLSDAFVALPGGLGTLEELFEVWTWAQLGLHRKPLALLDAGGYFAPLVGFLDHAVAEGFLKPVHRGMVLVEREPAALLDALVGYRIPEEALDLQRWIER
ncbi:MAG: TIGR00730 family Rossman fold protein [Acidobacteriota bacterium]